MAETGQQPVPPRTDPIRTTVRSAFLLWQFIASIGAAVVGFGAIRAIVAYGSWNFVLPVICLGALVFALYWSRRSGPRNKVPDGEGPRSGRRIGDATPAGHPSLGQATGPRDDQADAFRYRARVVLIIVAVSLFLGMNVIAPYAGWSVVRPDAWSLITQSSWMDFVPDGYSPPPHERMPSQENIARQLSWIKKAGFQGIITFGSDDLLASLPRLAKRQGLKVIMGIYDPRSKVEFYNAVEQSKFVDGYVVGHSRLGTPGGYNLNQLRSAVDTLRFLTWRPVAVSEEITSYRNPAVRSLGDWLFPDVHETFLDGPANPLHDAETVQQSAMQFQDLISGDSRPVLLGMVMYPDAGTRGASLQSQQQFFLDLVQLRRDPAGALHRWDFAVHAAFDEPYKSPGTIAPEYFSGDPHTGLFNDTGTPRPALSAALELSTVVPT
jgi:exo-beta-1,3-glucanase (GH17 family)